MVGIKTSRRATAGRAPRRGEGIAAAAAAVRRMDKRRVAAVNGCE